MTDPLAGLEDVVVTTSTITFIDGEKGILRYRGYDVNELAEKSNYEEVCYLLLYGTLPTDDQFRAFQKELRANRTIPEPVFKILLELPPKTEPMAVLRTAVSALSGFDPDDRDMSEAANLRKTIRLIGQLATLTAAIDRLRKKLPVIPPDPTLDHSANFLYMLTGKKPDATATRAIDIALILQADHELNASTFAGRVTVSTLSDLHSGVVTAIGTLKGPLHGGANQAVMEMLEKIGSVDKVESFVEEQIKAHKKIMGFGHRVYVNVDPRAAILRKMSEQLSKTVGPSKWFEMSDVMQKRVYQEKKLNANLDFYSASVYRYVGIANDLFTLIFAMSRVVGWCTHFMEQYAHNRLIRPSTQYTGPQGLTYQPLASRSTVPTR